jgi:class 3 adenylate cyclase/tetratricopeptide (TPR) repeat protein
VALCVSCGTDNPERAKFCLECGATLAQPSEGSRGARKLVTVLFADVVGSTALGEQLDPETMRSALARYFGVARNVLERHGGTVEKFIGDAVMAVFGIPLMHEDDALRAVRAALELRSEIGRLNDDLAAERRLRVEFRIGVNSGTVVAGGGEGSGSFVTGDAVNVAARLEQAAAAGEVLIGDSTYHLVRDHVRVESSPPLAVKGKSAELRAYRLLGLADAGAGRTGERQQPFVGRRRELARLGQAFGDAGIERRCYLFTLLGSAGVGKSRLVGEFLAAHAAEATVLSGRCLPYGEGITYWPVVEIIRSATHAEEHEDAAVIRDRIATMVAADPNAERIADLLASMLGLTTVNAPPEERHWAVRRFLESRARDQALICLIEDIHWAEPGLLDLLENIADWMRGVPMLLLCTARPELLEARPAWGGGKVNATTLLLEPLNADSTRELVMGLLGAAALPAALVDRILSTAEGNPLFAEEITRMLIDDGELLTAGEDVPIPTSIQAVIAARLDHLPGPERMVAERAAVAGRVFERGAVMALVAEEDHDRVAGLLLGLVRKELVQPSEPDLTSDEAFRFRHLLIRDTAYGGLPKQDRAELHERFAGWVERVASERVDEYAEIIGYHYEQAVRYRRELGLDEARTTELARRGGERMRGAGQRAYLRGDRDGAIRLLERSLTLLPAGPVRRQALITLVLASGAESQLRGIEAANQLVDEALVAGDAADELKGRVLTVVRRTFADPDYVASGATDEVNAALAVFERLGDEQGMAFAEAALSIIYLGLAHWQRSREHAERGLAHALAAGDGAMADSMRFHILNSALWGPTGAAEFLALANRLAAEVESASGLGNILNLRSFGHAMTGNGSAARTDIEEAMRLRRELGDPDLAWTFCAAPVEQTLGDLEAADALASSTIAVLETIGETGQRSSLFGIRARIAFDRGRPDAEVTGYADACRRLAADDDTVSQTQWRAAMALVAARAGRIDDAKQLIGEAATIIAASDFLYLLGLTAQDRGYIHAQAGELDEARRRYEEALTLFEQKGDVMDAGRVRETLAALG